MLQTGLVWNKNIRYNHICKGGGIVKVLKILNNNFILVKNAKGQEEIIMGRGLRFKTQVGGCLEEKLSLIHIWGGRGNIYTGWLPSWQMGRIRNRSVCGLIPRQRKRY